MCRQVNELAIGDQSGAGDAAGGEDLGSAGVAQASVLHHFAVVAGIDEFIQQSADRCSWRDLTRRVGDSLYEGAAQNPLVTILENLRFTEQLDENILTNSADAADLSRTQGKELLETSDIVAELVVDGGNILRGADRSSVLQVLLDTIPDAVLVTFTMPGQLFQLEGPQVPRTGFHVGEFRLEHGGLACLYTVDRQRGATPGRHKTTELYAAQLRRPHEDLGLTHKDRRRQRIVDVDLADDTGVRKPHAASKALGQGDDVWRIFSQGCRGEHGIDNHVRQVRRGIEQGGTDDEIVDRSSQRIGQWCGQSSEQPCSEVVEADTEAQTAVAGKHGQTNEHREQQDHPGIHTPPRQAAQFENGDGRIVAKDSAQRSRHPGEHELRASPMQHCVHEQDRRHRQQQADRPTQVATEAGLQARRIEGCRRVRSKDQHAAADAEGQSQNNLGFGIPHGYAEADAEQQAERGASRP